MQLPLKVCGNWDFDHADATGDDTKTCIFGKLGDNSQAIALAYLLRLGPAASCECLPALIPGLLEVLAAFDFVKSVNLFPILVGIIVVRLDSLRRSHPKFREHAQSLGISFFAATIVA